MHNQFQIFKNFRVRYSTHLNFGIFIQYQRSPALDEADSPTPPVDITHSVPAHLQPARGPSLQQQPLPQLRSQANVQDSNLNPAQAQPFPAVAVEQQTSAQGQHQGQEQGGVGNISGVSVFTPEPAATFPVKTDLAPRGPKLDSNTVVLPEVVHLNPMEEPGPSHPAFAPTSRNITPELAASPTVAEARAPEPNSASTSIAPKPPILSSTRLEIFFHHVKSSGESMCRSCFRE